MEIATGDVHHARVAGRRSKPCDDPRWWLLSRDVLAKLPATSEELLPSRGRGNRGNETMRQCLAYLENEGEAEYRNGVWLPVGWRARAG